MRYTEDHYCKKHKLAYTVTIWAEKPLCPRCWEEKKEKPKRLSGTRRVIC